MEILNLIFKDYTGLLVGICIFYYLLKQIENADPESKLHMLSEKDSAISCFNFLISNAIVNYRFTNIVDRLFYMAMFGIMTMHAYTDSKTKTVYRPFNYCLWIIGGIYYILKLFVLKTVLVFDEGTLNTIAFTGIFIFIIYLFTFTFHFSGKGDGYMLIGLALFIPFLAENTYFISLVIMLIYYIIAGFFQIFSNLGSMDFKKLRFKEKLPFAPALLYGLWITLILTKFLSSDYFKTWQLAHMF